MVSVPPEAAVRRRYDRACVMGILKAIGSVILLIFFLLAFNEVFGIFTDSDLWFLHYFW